MLKSRKKKNNHPQWFSVDAGKPPVAVNGRNTLRLAQKSNGSGA